MMITCKIFRRDMFRAVIFFILLTGLCFYAIPSNSNEDMAARKKLVEKYSDYKLIRDRLETILIIGWSAVEGGHREEVAKFARAPYDIANEKTPKATEALVDLLDFYIGERNDVMIRQLISDRGREAIPFLKRNISQKPLSSEQNIGDRNKVIVELIKMISCGVKYFNDPEDLDISKEEIVRSYLFSIQMDLEKHYREKGCYPKALSQTRWKSPFLEIIEKNMGQELKYKGYGEIYFLCSLGEDGKFGTKDDVKPPYNTDVFSFPEDFKE